MTAMMKTVIISGTGTGANIGKPAAGKTGTTDDCRDAYFVGYTPDIVTGVWVGDDNNKQVNGLYGGTIPARIWKEVMTVATRDMGAKDFDYPQIDLENYNKDGKDEVRIIGDDENPENEGKTIVVPNTDEETKALIDNVVKNAEEAKAKDKKDKKDKEDKKEEKGQTAPVPAQKSVTNAAPIPMAMPDSLR